MAPCGRGVRAISARTAPLSAAITGLLYGIPIRSADTHAHGSDLRIAAELVGPDGEPISLQRRKGRKNTLLDHDGEPLDEVVLSSLLRGVGRGAFLSTFGLEALGACGAALLKAGELATRPGAAQRWPASQGVLGLFVHSHGQQCCS